MRLAMDELWEMFETIGVASRAREIAMVMPRFHDWYAPAARLVSAGVVAAAEAVEKEGVGEERLREGK